MAVHYTGSGNSWDGFGTAARGILFLTFLFFLNFLSRIIFSPLLPIIKDEFGLSMGQSGSIFFFISSGYLISVSLSGFVSARLNHANTILLSSLAAAITLALLTFFHSFFLFCLGLFILGLAAGLYLPSGLSTIYGGVQRNFLARGIAIHELAPNLGFVMAPVLWLAASSYLSWREGVLVLSAMLVITGLAYRFSRYPSRARGTRPDFGLIVRLGRDGRFWVLVYLFSVAICSTLGLYAMLPLFLVNSHAMSVESANSLVAITRIFSLFTPFLGGWLGDRFGNITVMTAILISGGLLTIWLGLSGGQMLVVLLALQAMVTVCFFPSALALLTSLSIDGRENVAVPFCIPLGFVLGGGVLPFMIGLVGDLTSIATGITIAGGTIFFTGLLSLVFMRHLFSEMK